MKKIFKIFIFIFLCLFLNITSVYAEGDISIKSIRVVGQSGTITLGDLDYSNNTINSNITFNQINDFVTYEIEIQNDSYNNYPLNSITTNLDNDYLSIETEDIGTTIEKKSTKAIRVKIKYINEVINVEELDLGNIVLSFNYNDNPTIINPTTGFNIKDMIMPICILFILLLGFILFKIKKRQIILLLLFLPILVIAKEITMTLTFNSVVIKGRMIQYKVIIDDGSEVLSLKERAYGEEVGTLLYTNRKGYNFIGWEDQDKNPVTADTVIQEDTTIRAKYEPIEYPITYDLNGGTLREDNPSIFSIESEFTLNNPTKEGYTFVGWQRGRSCYPSYTIYEGTIADPRDAEMYFTAIFAEGDTRLLTVKHMIDTDRGWVEADRDVYTGVVGTTVRPQEKSYNGYDSPRSESITITEDGDNTLTYSYYKKRCQFNLEEFDGLDLENTTGNGWYPYGTEITINAEKKEGYTLWWSDGEVGFHRTFNLEKNTQLKAMYIPNRNVSYRIIHKLQELGEIDVLDSYYTVDDDYYYGVLGSEIETHPNIYEGFTSPKDEKLELTIDGVNTITYYYTRNKYRLSFEEEENIESNLASGEYYYGTRIEVSAKRKDGYSFEKWSDGNVYNPRSFELEGDTTLRAIYGEASAMFDNGPIVNQKMKRLSGQSSPSYSTTNTSIMIITRASSLPRDFTPTTDNIVSSSESDNLIYMWYEGSTIYYYTNVRKIYLGYNASYMFDELRYLISIDGIENWDTVRTKSMNFMFAYAGYYVSPFNIDLSNWNTSNVTTMENMFFCTGYYSAIWNIGDLSNWDTSKVTTMHAMFNGAGYNATTWDIGDLSNWDTSKVTTMHAMFNGAGYNATTWNSIGNLKIYANNIEGMFSYCPRATAILSVYSNPTSYGYAFNNAATLSNLGITVNYSENTTNIDVIIATKSSNSNVRKGLVFYPNR